MTTSMRTTFRMVTLVLMLTTVGCDRVTKHLATAKLAGNPGYSYLSDTVRFEYAENPGAFLSLGAKLPTSARTVLLTIGAALGLAAVAVVAFTLRWRGASLNGAVLFLAGGASNLVDRMSHGTVVDFMNVGVGSVRTGIFNVADVALMIGVALMVAGTHRKGNSRRD
jgi:signal peptidase II